MSQDDGNKLGRFARPTVSDGGRAKERRTRSDIELGRAVRELLYAMRNRDGNSVNKNFRNAARGYTKPIRILIRRLREAKAARNDRHHYPLAKQIGREYDKWVDDLFLNPSYTTGEHSPPPAAPAARKAA